MKRSVTLCLFGKNDHGPYTLTYTTAYKAGDGKTRLQVSLPATLPQGVVISWKVQAGDTAEAWSGFSTPACEFVFDKTAPPEPDIDSPEFLPLDEGDTTSVCLPDEEDRGYAGLYSTFTFDVPGEWYVGEQAGAPAVADARALHPIDVPAQITLGVGGPGCQNAVGACDRDRAARFTGADDSFLAARTSALVDTSKAFSATAWVRLTDDGQERVAISQDGSGQPGFTLGLDAATRKWAFKIPTTDVNSLGGWASVSGTAAVKNEWTHLAGVYDSERLTVQLYVNGVAQTATPRRSAFKSRGAVQIGRRIDRGGYRDAWKGDLADVAVYDRVVPGKELSALVKLRPIRQGYWQR